MIQSGYYNPPEGKPRYYEINTNSNYFPDKLPPIPVIYAISGLYHNVLTDTSLIPGSTINGRRRELEHKRHLINQTHTNPYLQNSFNKYGLDSFVFVVLENCDVEKLLEREQAWLDYYRDNYGLKSVFNCSDRVDKTRLGLQSKVMKEYFSNMDNRYKTSQANNHLKKTVWLAHPDHGVRRVVGISQFARSLGIGRANLFAVAKGKKKSYKGWRLASVEEIETLIK